MPFDSLPSYGRIFPSQNATIQAIFSNLTSTWAYLGDCEYLTGRAYQVRTPASPLQQTNELLCCPDDQCGEGQTSVHNLTIAFVVLAVLLSVLVIIEMISVKWLLYPAHHDTGTDTCVEVWPVHSLL